VGQPLIYWVGLYERKSSAKSQALELTYVEKDNRSVIKTANWPSQFRPFVFHFQAEQFKIIVSPFSAEYFGQI